MASVVSLKLHSPMAVGHVACTHARARTAGRGAAPHARTRQNRGSIHHPLPLPLPMLGAMTAALWPLGHRTHPLAPKNPLASARVPHPPPCPPDPDPSPLPPALQIKFPTPYDQIWAIILLAVVGGYLGCLFISFNTWVCVVRKRWTKFMWARIAEVRWRWCMQALQAGRQAWPRRRRRRKRGGRPPAGAG